MTASTLAGFTNYYIGKQFNSYTSRVKNYHKYKALFDKYGKYVLLISALGPVPYVPFGWISGAVKLKMKTYIFYAIIPRIIRLSAVLLFFILIKT